MIPPPPEDFGADAPDSIRVRTLAHIDDRRRGPPPSVVARGGDPGRPTATATPSSVATIQQVMANNGHANGHRFFSEKTGDLVFQRQVGGVDMVLGVDMSFGAGLRTGEQLRARSVRAPVSGADSAARSS